MPGGSPSLQNHITRSDPIVFSALHYYVFAFQECGGAAWPLLQTVYSCRTCGHTVHGSCLVNIRRPCVGAFLNRLPGEEEEEGFPKKIVAIDRKMIDQVFTMELSPLQFAPSSHWRSSSTSVLSARSTCRPVRPGWVSFKDSFQDHHIETFSSFPGVRLHWSILLSKLPLGGHLTFPSSDSLQLGLHPTAYGSSILLPGL